MAKTKAETLEQLEFIGTQITLLEEIANHLHNVVTETCDYVESSHDLRQEQQEQSDYHDKKEKEN